MEDLGKFVKIEVRAANAGGGGKRQTVAQKAEAMTAPGGSHGARSSKERAAVHATAKWAQGQRSPQKAFASAMKGF